MTRPSIAAALLLALAACGSAQSAARRDPMMCERDPACAKSRLDYRDCSLQCVDDPECMDRCRQIAPEGLGHPQ